MMKRRLIATWLNEEKTVQVCDATKAELRQMPATKKAIKLLRLI
jgi:hypothetical protein